MCAYHPSARTANHSLVLLSLMLSRSIATPFFTSSINWLIDYQMQNVWLIQMSLTHFCLTETKSHEVGLLSVVGSKAY